jgi:apolipoprotein N-acyltransferase
MTAAATPSSGRFSRAARGTGEYIRGLTGWRRYALSFGLGLVSALSFAPFGIFPLLLLALAALVLLVDGAQHQRRAVWRAAAIGWMFGFGHFLAGLYWVGYAFTVDASEHAWQIPFVAALLPGYLAIFPAAACGVMSKFGRSGSARIFIFAAAYGAAEWLRGFLLTGFPWNLPAYAWGAVPAILQSAALFGAYALSLLTVLLGASLARFCDSDSGAWKLPAATIALFACFWIGGEIRLATVDPGNVPGVRLRIVQPDVPQREKYLPQYVVRNWARLMDPSNAPAKIRPTVFIWPEAAPPFLLTRHPVALDDIALLTGNDRTLITGAARILVTPDDGLQYFNSLYIFGHGGQLLDVYNKFHLVPFGEYLPLSDLLTALGISKLVDSPGGFTAGDGPHTYAVPGAPAAGPLICYEILFPGEVVGRTRPGWIVNVTDDSWFGPSTGPYQHLLTARVRAIEEGLPVARAANTGISAVIDPLGRVTASLGLGQMGFVDADLPNALSSTPFARLGETGFALLLVACIFGGISGALSKISVSRRSPFRE